MTSQPLVSVILPFHNHGRFLPAAIDSVRAQSYGNWELLLVDDGAADGSSPIGQQYARLSPGKVRCLAHPGRQNRGACPSRNLGMTNARGDYLAFLDADDAWFPHKLQQQVSILQANPAAGMVYGATQYWHSWNGAGGDYVEHPRVPTGVLHEPPGLLLLCHPLGQAPAASLSNLMLRRELASRLGGFDEAFHGVRQLYDDQAFLAKLYLHAPVLVSAQCWDRYRQHTDSCCALAKKAGSEWAARHFYLRWLEDYFVRSGVRDRGLWRALRRAQLPHRYPRLYRTIRPGWRLLRQMV